MLERVGDRRLEEVERIAHCVPGALDAVDQDARPDTRWTVDLTKEPFEEMVEAAVRAAVRRSVHPVTVRAGRYMVSERSSSLD